MRLVLLGRTLVTHPTLLEEAPIRSGTVIHNAIIFLQETGKVRNAPKLPLAGTRCFAQELQGRVGVELVGNGFDLVR